MSAEYDPSWSIQSVFKTVVISIYRMTTIGGEKRHVSFCDCDLQSAKFGTCRIGTKLEISQRVDLIHHVSRKAGQIRQEWVLYS